MKTMRRALRQIAEKGGKVELTAGSVTVAFQQGKGREVDCTIKVQGADGDSLTVTVVRGEVGHASWHLIAKDKHQAFVTSAGMITEAKP